MKICFKCGEAKPLTDYYKHPRMADGHLNKCKACTKADANKHRADNLEKVQAYDRARASQPHRVEARAAYQQTAAYAASHAKANAAYRERHPDRERARNAVNNAIRDGKLIPWPVCALPDCDAAPEAHHAHYDDPLSVVWLCDHHHKEAHKLGRELERAAA
jgi:hypothetical protein